MDSALTRAGVHALAPAGYTEKPTVVRVRVRAASAQAAVARIRDGLREHVDLDSSAFSDMVVD